VFAGQVFCLWDSYGLGDYELRAGSFSDTRQDCQSAQGYAAQVQHRHGKGLWGSLCGGCDSLKLVKTRMARSVYGAHHLPSIPKRCYVRLKRSSSANALDGSGSPRANPRRASASAPLHEGRKPCLSERSVSHLSFPASGICSTLYKSTLDAGWASLKTMLEYKCHQAGVVFEVVNENYTTQTCSCCGAIPASSPKGRAGLRMREWACSGCGAVHDRDVNAARKILALGLQRLAGGIQTPL